MQTYNLQPPAVLLMGGVGTGKTYSISTLLASGLEVFVIVTEPTGLDSLLDVIANKNLNLTKLHVKVITPARSSFTSLLETAKKIAVMDYDSLSKLRPDTSTRRTARWITLLETLSNFTCDLSGKTFGSVTEFTSNQCLVIDSLSGLNIMAMDLVIGDKPTAHQGEWGTAMNAIEKLMLNLGGLNCFFILTSHLDREQNELTGGTIITAAALGRKLGPKLLRFFSEVVLAYREGDKFFWSTTATGVDLKNRSLPLSNKLEPSFHPIVQAYKLRLQQLKGAAAHAQT